MASLIEPTFENLVASFDSNTPESVKYVEGKVDVSWLEGRDVYLYAEQLAGVIMDAGLASKEPSDATYEFYFKMANATDEQRLVAFDRFLQLTRV